MPRWLLNSQRKLFDLDDENNGGGGENKEPTNPDTPKDGEGEKKEDKTESIPKYRFDEVNEKRKQAEAELAKYKEAEAKKAEEEALKKGEYEKIISQKDQEIADFKKQQESWKAREEVVSKRNQERTEALAKKYGDDWNSVKNLIDDITDPFILSSKLDSLEKVVSQKTGSAPKGGSNLPSGGGSSRKQELMSRLEKGERLTAKERSELFSEINKSQE